MTAGLATNSWESRLNNYQQELKDKENLFTEVNKKYQEMSLTYQEEKKKNY